MHQIVEYVRNNGGIHSKGSSQNNVIGHTGCLDHIKIYLDAEGDGTTILPYITRLMGMHNEICLNAPNCGICVE